MNIGVFVSSGPWLPLTGQEQ